ncbi:MAG: putative toxin-antitoxin system toxin component, PIN family [Solirubrobacteraceae bacterium]
MTRLVIDASVLLSGIASSPGSGSPPALILDALTDMGFEAVVSPRLIAEVNRGLQKPYFKDRVSESEAARIIEAIHAAAVTFDDPVEPPRLLRDPDDDYLPALAKASNAQAIVTGDRDLLDDAAIQPPAIDARSACALLGLAQPGGAEPSDDPSGSTP